ncbi:arginyl-tRNA synthetase [Phaeosphaeriaceae sp. SRC1lsM3a]|nr:arginyl-tRNA synthetase [Stagonospora sp. SRC1lsM3a]
MEALKQTFQNIGLDAPASSETLLHNFTRPLEVYRICLVKLLSDILECEEDVAQKCVLWPNNIDNGDLAVVLPKLRPGVKADKTAVEIMEKHLRSTIIGAFLSRLHESLGWKVTRINYLGDWGKPIALLYVGWTKFGSQEAYDADPVGHLLDIYHQIDALFQPEQAASRQARDDAAKEGKDEGEAQAEIESQGIFAERNEAFKKLEEGDEEVKRFWDGVRDVVVDDYSRFYERLGVRFDEYTGESQVSASTMAEVEQMLKDKNIVEESAGAWMVDMTKLGARAGHAIVRDRSGSSTYLLRDLAAVLERSRKHSFDRMIYVVASDNSVHFNQMFKILEALNRDLADKLHHVKFSEVSKMSTSLGKGYKPQAILDKCEEAIVSLVEDVTTPLSDADFDALAEAEDQVNLLRVLAQYPEVVNAAYHSLESSNHAIESSGIVTYLSSVTEQLSDCLDDEEGEIDMSLQNVITIDQPPRKPSSLSSHMTPSSTGMPENRNMVVH